MGRSFRWLHGGWVAFFAVAAVLSLDIGFADRFPSLRISPEEHLAELIAASGVAVAFVLTYLAALTGLPSPGRQLLSSALTLMKNQEPFLPALEAEGRISPTEFLRLEQCLDRALDLGKHDEDAIKGHQIFMRIVSLAKPNPTGINLSIDQVEELGYSRLRAWFLSTVVFKHDAEKCLLLRATILCAIVFSYTSFVYFLELMGKMGSSSILMFGYPILAIVGAGFAVAMSLRMWPHEVRHPSIEKILDLLERSLQIKIEKSTNLLDVVIARAADQARVRDSGAGKPPTEINQEMVDAGLQALATHSPGGSQDLVKSIYAAMIAAQK